MGEVVSLDISSMVTVFRDDGKRIRIPGVNIDVTEFKQSEAKLKPAASVFIHIREGILPSQIRLTTLLMSMMRSLLFYKNFF